MTRRGSGVRIPHGPPWCPVEMLVICAFRVVPETLLVAILVAKLCFHGTRPLRHCQLRTHGFRGHDEGPTRCWRPCRNHTDHRPKAIDASARIYTEGVIDTHRTPPHPRSECWPTQSRSEIHRAITSAIRSEGPPVRSMRLSSYSYSS